MDRSAHDPDRPVEAMEIARQKEEEEKQRKVLRARPVTGEIDHAALIREIIARFPKILAELAK